MVDISITVTHLPAQVVFTHYFPVLDSALEAKKLRELTWCTEPGLGGRFHTEHLVAREGDDHFHRLVGGEGWTT